MISILVPVMNFDARPLAGSLQQQAARLGVEYEIRIRDDGSDPVFHQKNREMTSLPFTVYCHSPVSIGRAATRNRLANEAKYPHCLFADGDAQVIHPGFLERYLDLAGTCQVICGGVMYTQEPPENRDLFLRWQYGKKREAVPAHEREKKPYQAFSTFNFLIEKQVFEAVRFNERLLKYGHEDTLFGLALKGKGISLIHTDNPLLHGGLETARVFLSKTEQGLENLFALLQEGHIPDQGHGIRIIHALHRIRSLGLSGFVQSLFNTVRGNLLDNLLGKAPSLFLLDLYKLGYLNALR